MSNFHLPARLYGSVQFSLLFSEARYLLANGFGPRRYLSDTEINVQIQPFGCCSEKVFFGMVHAHELMDAFFIISQ